MFDVSLIFELAQLMCSVNIENVSEILFNMILYSHVSFIFFYFSFGFKRIYAPFSWQIKLTKCYMSIYINICLA